MKPTDFIWPRKELIAITLLLICYSLLAGQYGVALYEALFLIVAIFFYNLYVKVISSKSYEMLPMAIIGAIIIVVLIYTLYRFL